MYHHAHHLYKGTALCAQKPKFCAGKGQMNPRGILRYPIHSGLVTAEDLMRVAAPAASQIIVAFVDTAGELLPQVFLPNFFFLLTHMPEVNWWNAREMRHPEETKVEQKFLEEMLNAIKSLGF
jgi:hypothetical protein